MAAVDPRDLATILAEVVRRLRDALNPSEIFLFGSYAYGTPNAASDLDILVIVEQSPLHPFDRDAAAYRALRGLGVPKDVQVYTRNEFESRAACKTSFEATIKEKGRRLYAA